MKPGTCNEPVTAVTFRNKPRGMPTNSRAAPTVFLVLSPRTVTSLVLFVALPQRRFGLTILHVPPRGTTFWPHYFNGLRSTVLTVVSSPFVGGSMSCHIRRRTVLCHIKLLALCPGVAWQPGPTLWGGGGGAGGICTKV